MTSYKVDASLFCFRLFVCYTWAGNIFILISTAANMPGHEISEDAKCILLQVLRILRKEKGFGRPVGSVSNITRRFKLLTGYDLSTATKIENQQKLSKHMKSKLNSNVNVVHRVEKSSTYVPVRRGPNPKLDSFDREIVRRAIHSMYTAGMPVSLPGLQKWLSSHHPEMQRTTQATLRRAAIRLGFRYQRGMPSKRFRGTEEAQVVAARIRYKPNN